MRFLLFTGSLFMATALLAEQSTPYSLAHLAFQGAYANIKLESGDRLGYHDDFCKNAYAYPSDVAATIFATAIYEEQPLMPMPEDEFVEHVENQVIYICRNRKSTDY